MISGFAFLVFFAATTFVYYILPARVRYLWLFAAGIFFYFTQGAAGTVFLLASILLTWGGGLLLAKWTEAPGRKRGVLAAALFCNLGLLLYLKYIGFLTGGLLASPILPIGISFYVLQSSGYLIDVYRGTVLPERNPVRYGLFVSFFPTVLSGPIERAGHLLPQLATAHGQAVGESAHPADIGVGVRFDATRLRDGFVRMLWGYFCKMVLADRIAIAVDAVYAAPAAYGGAVLFVTTVLYSLQIYLDFSGYSSIAIGAAKVMGLEVMENFDSPYLAKNIGDFWRRWHISLSSWFRDYVYIPLGGNRKGRARMLANIVIVFLVSGFWHGTGWTFLLWGLLHGLYRVIEVLFASVRKCPGGALPGGGDSASVRMLQVLRTFLLVDLAWIFFRADTVGTAFAVFRGFAQPALSQLFDGTLLSLGVNAVEWRLVLLGLALVFLADFGNLRSSRVAEWISKQALFIRWPVYIMGVVLVVICGVWGPGYEAARFIYYQF